MSPNEADAIVAQRVAAFKAKRKAEHERWTAEEQAWRQWQIRKAQVRALLPPFVLWIFLIGAIALVGLSR